MSTQRIRLGPLVNCVLYRAPVMLAHLAADVDRMSGGRLILGLGAGWAADEFTRLGVRFPPVEERLATLRRTVAEVRQLWTGKPLGFDPVRHEMTGSALPMGPVQRPRVPLLIGGNGEQVTLRRVAEAADMCNLDASGGRLTPDAIRRKYGVLRVHCERIGRSYESVVRSHLLNPVVLAETADRLEAKLAALPPIYRHAPGQGYGTPRDLVERYRPVVEAGAQYLIVNLAPYDLETLELVASRVMPELHRLAASSRSAD